MSELVFVILILLPWLGGLILVAFAGCYFVRIIRLQADRLDQYRNENRDLSQECNRLDAENKDLNLKLQIAWVENAMIGKESEENSAG
jgi:hypothetical protein